MKLYIIAVLTALMFTAGILAGATEKQVAKQRGVAPIAEAEAMDDIATNVCQGGAGPMCYPPECGGDGTECPVNNQCMGFKFCQLHAEAHSSGMKTYSCSTSALCDSSRDAEDGFRIAASTDAVTPASTVSGDSSAAPRKPTAPGDQRLYTSYY